MFYVKNNLAMMSFCLIMKINKWPLMVTRLKYGSRDRIIFRFLFTGKAHSC